MYLTLVCGIEVKGAFAKLHPVACRWAYALGMRQMVLAAMPNVVTFYPRFGYVELRPKEWQHLREQAELQRSRPTSPA